MSKNDSEGLYTDPNSFNPKVNAIPLSDVDTHPKGKAGIKDLVMDASSQFSSLVRSEVELAKTELTQSAKKAGIAAGLFGAAGVIAAYSSFFLFFFLAELLATWLPRWAAFLIVFVFMLVLVAALALVGVKQIKGVKKPEKTIESVNDMKELVPSRDGNGSRSLGQESGMYT